MLSMTQRKIMLSILVVLLMVGSAFFVFGMPTTTGSSTSIGYNGTSGASNAQPAVSSSNPWQMPTTTMHEPGYTNGTFSCGIDCTISDLNTFSSVTFGDLFIEKMIYGSLYKTMPNGQIQPWLATGYTMTKVTKNNSTFDIETNSIVNYSYVFTVNLRPNVRWTDWSSANNSQTYTFSNNVQFNNASGSSFTHTYTSYSPTVMKKYYLQSGDVVSSWRLEAALGGWPGVVNVVPNGNLSIKMFVPKPTLLIQTSSLQSYILPFHIWKNHSYTSVKGLFNYTPGAKPGNGYYGWDLGWNTATGSAPGLVGNGPFMVNNGFGMPQGAIIPNQQDKYYVNPYFFTQYANKSSGLRQYTPKIYEFYQPYYASQSSMVGAFTKGQLDLLGVTAPFLSLVKGTPGAYIYSAPSQVFCAVRINENQTPLNITTFRQALAYATPYSTIDGTVYNDLLTPSSNTVPPCNVLWYNSSSPQYTYNMHEAKKLISNIHGMSNKTGVLTYNGTPVTIELQIAPGSETPCAAEIASEMQKSWASLGITTTIKEEAYSTMFANIYCTVIGHGNFYQMAEYGQGTESGDPAVLCALFVNDAPSYFDFGCTLGPYTSLNYNGHHLSGAQVTTLLTNLSNELLQTDSMSTAIHISKEIQTIVNDEVTLINLGYTTTMEAFQTNQFSNFTTTNSNTLFSLYFTLMEVYKAKTTTTVSYNYNMKIEQKMTGPLVETAGNTGSITYTVYNETTGMPVQGATIGISTSSVAKGLINITSNQLTTNATGQATWKYQVFSDLNNLLQTLKGSYPNFTVINLPNEVVNITATVNPPSHDIHTSSTSTYLNIELVNTNEKRNLVLTSKYNGNSHLYEGNSGSISYTVTNSTGTVSDANITVVVSGIAGSITSNAFSFSTSTGNTGTFYFNVSKLLSQLMQTYNSGSPMYLYDQEVNITAVASVGGQNQTGPGTTYNNVFLVNPSLVMSYSLGNSSYKTGQTGNLTFTVTRNGTAVSGAHIQLSSLNLVGLTYSNSSLNMTTNSKGVAVFSFKVGNATSGSGSYVTVNQSLVAKASTSNSSLLPATDNVHYSVSEKVLKPPASNTLMYVIIGVIAAVVVIVAAAFVVMRKPKVKS